MNIEIMSDGSPKSSVVRDAETKEIVSGCYAATWTHEIGDIPRVTISVLGHKAHLIGLLSEVIVKDVYTGKEETYKLVKDNDGK